MSDETETLRKIIEDCVDAELRWRESRPDPLATARAIATDIMARLKRNGIIVCADMHKGTEE